MTIPRPTPLWRRLLSSPVSYGSGRTLFTAMAGAGATIGLQAAGQTVWAAFAGLATACGVIEASLRLYKESARSSTHELEGCLETLIAILSPPGAPDFDPGLRATLHLPINRGASFVQVIDYVGSNRAGKTKGRVFRSNAGLAGRVLATRQAYAASRAVANHESYVRELVESWGLTEAEARQRDMSAMSWMAVPLEHGGNLEGLLYLDSTRPGFFDDPVRAKVCVSAAVGIAKFTVRRYTGGGEG